MRSGVAGGLGRGARRAPAPSRWRTSSASTPPARAWAEPGLRAARGPRLARAPMAAPDTTEEILDVNRRYHDVAAADYDTKWGVDFGEVGRIQVLGKVSKL